MHSAGEMMPSDLVATFLKSRKRRDPEGSIIELFDRKIMGTDWPFANGSSDGYLKRWATRTDEQTIDRLSSDLAGGWLMVEFLCVAQEDADQE